MTLGLFATVEEAALCYARTPEGRAAAVAAAASQPPMTAKEAMRQAEGEGLTLLTADKADDSLGYKYVTLCRRSGITKPYQAEMRRGGKQVFLGLFATAEEAALCIARTPEGRAASRNRGLAEADDCEANAIMVEAYELMDGDGDGDGPWNKDLCIVEARVWLCGTRGSARSSPRSIRPACSSCAK